MTSKDDDYQAGTFISTVYIQLCARGYMVSTWEAHRHLSPGDDYGWVRAHQWFLNNISTRLDVGEEKPLRVGVVQTRALYECNSYVVIAYYAGAKVCVFQQDRSEAGWTRAYLTTGADDTFGLADKIVRMTTELVEVVEGTLK